MAFRKHQIPHATFVLLGGHKAAAWSPKQGEEKPSAAGALARLRPSPPPASGARRRDTSLNPGMKKNDHRMGAACLAMRTSMTGVTHDNAA